MKTDTESIFEVWVKQSPLMVQERAEDGVKLCWNKSAPAINRAKQLKAYYPHMDFVVREESRQLQKIVFDTST